jgi:hypothetical protein
MFNSCPLISTRELSISFPSQDDVFEADAEEQYRHAFRVDIRPRGRPSQALKSLLEENWCAASYSEFAPADLGFVICGAYTIHRMISKVLIYPSTSISNYDCSILVSPIDNAVCHSPRDRSMGRALEDCDGTIQS